MELYSICSEFIRGVVLNAAQAQLCAFAVQSLRNTVAFILSRCYVGVQ